MILEGKLTVKAPIQKVWESLLDPSVLLFCIPGAEKIERLDEKTYDCVVKQKVGPISVRFRFKSVLTKMEPPRHLEFEGEGEDIGKAGHFVQKSVVELVEISGGVVEISYKSDVSIAGRLSMFGDRIMRAKAQSVQQELTKNLGEKLKSLV
jgi:carbon monoxide dehydrogenase subunit G